MIARNTCASYSSPVVKELQSAPEFINGHESTMHSFIWVTQQSHSTVPSGDKTLCMLISILPTGANLRASDHMSNECC